MRMFELQFTAVFNKNKKIPKSDSHLKAKLEVVRSM